MYLLTLHYVHEWPANRGAEQLRDQLLNAIVQISRIDWMASLRRFDTYKAISANKLSPKFCK